jgi:hypothetical protein
VTIAARSAGQDLCRWNGRSNTAANIRAKSSARGTPIARVAMKLATPGVMQGETISTATATMIGEWTS